MFINRGNNIQDFNSLVEPASDKWLLVLYGLNGVGKSALLKELSSSYVPGSRYVYVNFDETLYCHEPADFIHELEAGLKKCDLPESRWEEYRSKCREIDDWKHNQQVILNVSQNVEAIRGQINDVNQ
jgi:hypothetical protein